MNSRARIAWVLVVELVVELVVGLAYLQIAYADPPAIAQTEINYLLEYVEKSGCEFQRNGSWYDSKRARAHLNDKYQVLRAKNQIQSAEDFIAKAATKSSLSGRPYGIRCNGGGMISTDQWLRDALARYRAETARNAP